MMSIEFLITALIVVLIPGTGVIYTISTGLLKGSSFSIAAAIGCTLGIVPHLLASTFGLAALLHTSAVAFQTLKYIGVAYLLYLAYCMWKTDGHLTLNNKQTARTYKNTIVHGLLINILNPKLSIFFLAFLPQFIDANDPFALSSITGLGLLFMVLTLAVFIVYGLGAAGLRRHIIENPARLKKIQRAFSLTFVGLGIKLALEER